MHMKKLDLNEVAEEFEMIDGETRLFYNTETGEFDSYSDYNDFDDGDPERFEEDCWVAAPSQRDINEYDIMADFAGTVTDPRKSELLCVALEGRGAFRRVTWTRAGGKKIVWRCINRLDYGTKYCKKSPALEEEMIKSAIVKAITALATAEPLVLENLKLQMELGFQDTPDESAALRLRLNDDCRF